jgi:alpha-galactosidase
MRIDLGMMRQTHLSFLSDPDCPEHGLQVLWGAAAALPPNQLLHWGWSQWRSRHSEQTLDPADPGLQPHQIDYYRRIARVGATGMSYGLPDVPDRFRDRLAANIQTYKDIVRPFVRTADLHRLTEQPRRFGKGVRWAGFQYSRPDTDSHLVVLFRLPGGEAERTIPLRGLDKNRSYRLDAGTEEVRTGAELMTSGVRAALPEEGSVIITVNGL